MQPAGRARIEAAIADGSWTQLDAVEALEVPPDLEEAFAADGSARGFYDSLTRGKRKMILSFLNSAKREETRRLRIAKICEALRAGKMPVGG